MKPRLHLIVLLILCELMALPTAWAAQKQPFQLLWTAPQNFSTELYTEQRLHFQEAVYDGRLPYWQETLEYQGNTLPTVHLEHLQWADCDAQETALLSEEYLSDSLQVEVYAIGINQQARYQLRLLPLIRRNGRCLKLLRAEAYIQPTSAMREATDPGKRYAPHSVLQTGHWERIAVYQTGIYKLSYEFLQQVGFHDPSKVCVFGYGGNLLDESFAVGLTTHSDDLQELCVYRHWGADQQFGPGDYLLFYALGPIKKQADALTGRYTFTQNYYSTYGCYFLTDATGQGLEIQEDKELPTWLQENPETTDDYTQETYIGQQAALHEQELHNLLKSGREWFGETFATTSREQSFTLNLNHIHTEEDLFLEVTVAGHSTTRSSFSLQLNGQPLSNTISIAAATSYYQAACSGALRTNVPNTVRDMPRLTLTYNANSNADMGYLNQLAVNALCDLYMDGAPLSVWYPRNMGLGEIMLYHIANAPAQTAVWNITNPQTISFLPTTREGGYLNFKNLHEKKREYLAVPIDGIYPEPTTLGSVPNQDLHSWGATDMVIICPPEFAQAGETLANLHRQQDGLNVKIAQPQQIYNEFSSGVPDATAFRWLLKMLYDRANGMEEKQPKFLQIIGLSSYDNRCIQESELYPLPSYQSQESLLETASYTTDDYYGLLQDNKGTSIISESMDISVGRLPVKTATEANNVVAKILRYRANELKGTWKSTIAFLADDGDNNTHVKQADKLTQDLYALNPAYRADKVYLDAYPLQQSASGGTYPGATERIHTDLEKGVLVFTYVGHGSPNTLTGEQAVSRNYINNMYNDAMALWVTASCDFSRYDDNTSSAGLEVLTNPHGGGIGLLSTTRVVFSSENFKLAQKIYQYIVPKPGATPLSMGEIARRAKADLGYDRNKLNFCLLGDPALFLNYPRNYVVIDSINHQLPSESLMQALGIIHVRGHISDEAGDSLRDYTGTLHINLYDKEEALSTLGNDGNTPFPYMDYVNVLFSGKTSVANGSFSTSFMMPKDINYKEGNGRAFLYVEQSNGKDDAMGDEERFYVGGTDSTAVPATAGPIIRMYLNNEHFINGQTVNDSPVLYAFLSDSSGINVVGSGIGHDIKVTLNDNPAYSHILNDYYEATLDDYRSGKLSYHFYQLPTGKYTLKLRAWNLQNISTTAQLEFEVNPEVAPTIYEFTVTPSPASDWLELKLQHDRPDCVTQVHFWVYDTSGRVYWNKEAEAQTEDGSFTARWLIPDAARGVGVFVAKVEINTTDSRTSTKTQKFLLQPQ